MTKIYFLIASIFLVCMHGQSSVSSTCDVPSFEQIDVEDVHRLVKPPCHFDLDRLVRSLPTEMRDSAAFMKKSASLVKRCTDANNPRIIYSAPRVVIAVPWKSTKDDDCKIIEAFGASEETQGLNPTHIDFRTRDAVIDSTGTRCVGCHAQHFTPIWDTYPNWKSSHHEAFGSDDDNVLIDTEEFEILKSFVSDVAASEKMGWFGDRMDRLAKAIHYLGSPFKACKKNPDCLRALGPVSFGTRDLPFAFSNGISFKSPDYGARPNLKLSIILNDLNSKAIAGQIFSKVSRDDIVATMKQIDFCRDVYDMNRGPSPDYNGYKIILPLLEKAGLTLNNLSFTLAFSPIKNLYNDGNVSGHHAVIRELLIGLGIPVDENGLRSFFDVYFGVKVRASAEFQCEVLNQKIKFL